MTGHVLVFAKPPRMGMAKTRLARDIGPVEAWRIKRRLDRLTLAMAHDRRWRTTLVVAPDVAAREHFPGIWPGIWPKPMSEPMPRIMPVGSPNALPRQRQGPGDLGARMARAMRAHAPGSARDGVVIIGTDAPRLTASDLADAFAALRRHDCVVGPSCDGGYWLIGARPRLAARITLAKVRWSGPH
jgi:uncharacterized protein